jgi:hypothetical protein
MKGRASWRLTGADQVYLRPFGPAASTTGSSSLILTGLSGREDRSLTPCSHRHRFHERLKILEGTRIYPPLSWQAACVAKTIVPSQSPSQLGSFYGQATRCKVARRAGESGRRAGFST